MKQIIIDIANWNRIDDKDVLRVVRDAINNSIKYECDRVLNKHHYWIDEEKKVEMQITYK